MTDMRFQEKRIWEPANLFLLISNATAGSPAIIVLPIQLKPQNKRKEERKREDASAAGYKNEDESAKCQISFSLSSFGCIFKESMGDSNEGAIMDKTNLIFLYFIIF